MSAAVDGVIPPGGSIPSFTLPRHDGGDLTVPDAAAKGLTLAVFYKNSCPTCRLTMPFIQRLHEQVAPAGGRVVAISQDGRDGAASFARELGLTMPILVDGTDYPVSSLYELIAVPTLYLVTSTGRITRSDAGFRKAGLAEMAGDLAASIGVPPPVLYHPGETIPDFKPG